MPARAVHDGPFKHGTVTGPIHDVFHEPIVFVWGACDPAQARANEETAEAWARVRWGVRVDYPVMSDADFFARGEPLANDRALFLVGNAKSNRVVRELEPSLPIRIDGDGLVVGDQRFAPKAGGADRSQLGAAFIRPNPRRPDRYVVVVEGVGPLGTWRVSFPAGHAPRLRGVRRGRGPRERPAAAGRRQAARRRFLRHRLVDADRHRRGRRGKAPSGRHDKLRRRAAGRSMTGP